MLVNFLLGSHFTLLLLIYLRVLARPDLSPQARLAWIVVLFLLPYVGVVVYWMFGEIHLGHNFLSQHRQITQKLHHFSPKILGSDLPSKGVGQARRIEATKSKQVVEITQSYTAPAVHEKSCYYPAIDLAASITGFNLTVGNRAKLMADAADTSHSMLADFEAATDHIHVMYYIWLLDDMGIATANALIRAANRGVICRAMVDGLGSRKLVRSTLWQKMQAAGVQLSVALPINNLFKTLLFSRIDLRNHRKITIIDGKVCYLGSRNCADPEFRVKPKYAPWVDIMLRFEGPIVAQNQMLFASDWLMQSPDTPLDNFKYSTQSFKDGFAAQVFEDGPTRPSGSTPQFLNTLLAQAQTSIIISTPYFVPDTVLMSVLCATAYRGVAVTMILPKKNDSFIVAATSRSYYLQLLQAGVKIYEYKLGLLHAKTLTVDGEVSMIGSTNLDLRSFDLNYENNVICYDEVITAKIIQRQYDYIADSVAVSYTVVENWALYYRIWNNVVATLGPVL